MSIIVGDKVFDPTCRSDLEVITAYEVRGDVMFGGVRASVAVDDRHGDAVRVRLAVCLGHAGCGRQGQRAGRKRTQSRSDVGKPVTPSLMPYISTSFIEETPGWSEPGELEEMKSVTE